MTSWIIVGAVVLVTIVFVFGPLRSPTFWGYGFKNPYTGKWDFS